jgi:23S rRNA pseudouridine955/2504/2580 synthase
MKPENYKLFTIGINDAGRRIDRVVRKLLPHIKLGDIYAHLRAGRIRLNREKVKPGTTTVEGDNLQVYKKLLAVPGTKTPPLSDDLSVPITKYIIFENEHVLILNKPKNSVVHGKNSLDQWVFRYLLPNIEPSLSFKPGPLHRLDRYTTGLIVFGKSLAGAQRFSSILQSRACAKFYIGIIEGTFLRKCRWDDSLLGKKAITVVTPLVSKENLTLCKFKLNTGRQHQIRRQSADHGFPLLGDRKYGGNGGYGKLLLHSLKIRLDSYDPLLGFSEVTAQPTSEMMERLITLFGKSAQKALSNI